MPDILLTCPHCGFSKQLDRSSIPQEVKTATCPRCKQGFVLETAMTPAPEAVGPAGPAPLPEGASGKATHASDGQEPSRKPRPQLIRFVFTGSAREYFGIWIVNTLLKIVTFGGYTAWAKVRKRRYFYGSTQLHDSPFEYLAEPMALFRGWLIAVLFFLLYSFGSKASQTAGIIFSVLFFVLMPWLVVRSRVFNQRNSAHRNIRFNFRPDYREAYVAFAGLPILLPFTLGMLFPYMVYRQKRFLVENSAFGRTACTFDATPKAFYVVFGKAAGWFLLFIVFFALGMAALSSTFNEFAPLFHDAGHSGTGGFPRNVAMAFAVVGMLFMLGLYLFFAVYVQTALANLTWNSTWIGHNRFASTLRVRDMAWLYLSSAAAIFLSLGLLIPWVSVRLARYRFDNLSLSMSDDPGNFSSVAHDEISAAGEEIGDVFGIDIAL